ncbi:MAG TPA: hypothetical protein VMI54_07240 [Polyangiaceae bacterium]|nr:hypothetical protein [Polyangiaceae bacterium]
MLRGKTLSCQMVVLSLLAAVGCSGGRDVDVSGDVSAAPAVLVTGPIKLNFLDVVNDTDPPKSAATTTLDELGPFEQKVSVSGDTVRVFALIDANGDGKCTAGEAWAEADAPVGADDKVAAVALTLAPGTCPTDVGE